MQLVRVDLTQSPPAVVADAAPWISGIAGLPQSAWHDLSNFGYPGVGYWPVIAIMPPTFNPKTQALGPPTLSVDAANKQVLLTQTVTALQSAPNQSYVAGLLRQARKAKAKGNTALATSLYLQAAGVQQ